MLTLCVCPEAVETVTGRKVWGGREVGGRKAGQTGGGSKTKSRLMAPEYKNKTATWNKFNRRNI